MYDEKGNFNQSKFTATTNSILAGTAYINRLLLEEESGRIRGGRRNVEATLILGANEGSGNKKQTGFEEQEEIIKRYAKFNNLWINDSFFNDQNFIAEGAEAKIYSLYKKGNVYKVVDYRRFSKTPLEYLDNRISLPNYLFPDTAYTLTGFTSTEDFTGKKVFAFVVEQSFVKGRYINFNDDQAKFQSEILKNNFSLKIENLRPILINNNYIIKDLHEENIIVTDGGSFRFIDTVPILNTPGQNVDGVRYYGNGRIIHI